MRRCGQRATHASPLRRCVCRLHVRAGFKPVLTYDRPYFRRDQSDSNIGEFRYAGSWLRNAHGRAFALDPVNLPLSTQTFFATQRGGLSGALADTTPDRWRQRLQRLAHPHAASRPLSPAELLLATGDERVGCLAFSRSEEPPAPAFLPIGTRHEIASAFDAIGRGADTDPKLLALYRAGQSLGGIPSIANCSSRCGEFGLSTDAAQAMADRMIERMRDWRHDFRELGVPAASMEQLTRVFSPELAK
jgi:hypothetical protein